MKIKPDLLYKILFNYFGTQNWWPIDSEYHKKNMSDSRYEIIIGAILTQNTTWTNVEKVLNNLKSRNMLDINKIINVEIEYLQNLVKSSGFFKQKSIRIKNLSLYLFDKYNANFDVFFNRDLYTIRNELLSLNGIGFETADTILLYAGNFPIFVVDSYTKRICKRMPLCNDLSYNYIQNYFERELSKKYLIENLTYVYNEIHALIVMLAKNYCKKIPICRKCPLVNYCIFQCDLTQ
jgi:endonuclease-3 related protein